MHILKASLAMVMVLSMAAIGEESSVPATESPQATPLQSIATTRQIMLGMTVPTSDAVFQVAVEPPQDPLGWERLEANAAVLALSAALLKQPSLAVDGGEWVEYSDALIAAAQATSQAARQQDAELVSDLGNEIYEVCAGCHMKYFAASGLTQ